MHISKYTGTQYVSTFEQASRETYTPSGVPPLEKESMEIGTPDPKRPEYPQCYCYTLDKTYTLRGLNVAHGFLHTCCDSWISGLPPPQQNETD